MEKDTNSYKGWLNSDDFVKRAFAVWGYMFVAQCLLWLAVMAVYIVVAFMGMILIGSSY